MRRRDKIALFAEKAKSSEALIQTDSLNVYGSNGFSGSMKDLTDQIKVLFNKEKKLSVPGAGTASMKDLTDQIKVLFDIEHNILSGGETLKEGARDSSTDGLVSKVQSLLQGHGYILSSNGVDGVFGSETEKTVLEFQRNNKENGLVESGEIDSATLKLLQGTAAKGRPENVPSGRNAPRPSGSGRISADKLYGDLRAGIADPNLCKAMVANAIAESALHYNSNGDCGSYAKGRKKRNIDTSLYPDSFRKPKRGGCCSFGLWQYNICGGLGQYGLLPAYGLSSSSSDEEKIAVLTSYEKQVQFMVNHVNRKAERSIGKNKSTDWWVEWFVRKVERPAKMDIAIAKRQQIARGLDFGKDIV